MCNRENPRNNHFLPPAWETELPDSCWKTIKREKKSKSAWPSGGKLKAMAKGIGTSALRRMAAVLKPRLRVTPQYIARLWQESWCLNLGRATVVYNGNCMGTVAFWVQADSNMCSPQHQAMLTVLLSPAGLWRRKVELLEVFHDTRKTRLFLGKRTVRTPGDLLHPQRNQNTSSDTSNIQANLCSRYHQMSLRKSSVWVTRVCVRSRCSWNCWIFLFLPGDLPSGLPLPVKQHPVSRLTRRAGPCTVMKRRGVKNLFLLLHQCLEECPVEELISTATQCCPHRQIRSVFPGSVCFPERCSLPGES